MNRYRGEDDTDVDWFELAMAAENKLELRKMAQAKTFTDMTGAPPPAADDGFEDAVTIRLGQRDFQGGRPDMDAGESAVPQLRLAQGLTPEVVAQEAKMGQWVLAGHDAVDEVIFVPGLYNKSRDRRLPQHEDPDRKIVCRSSNAVTAIGDPGTELAKQGKGCKDCGFATWTPNEKTGKNNPPACTLHYIYVGWSVTHEAMCLIDFKRTAETMAQQVNAFVQAFGLGNFAIKLKSTIKTTGRNSYAIPIPVFYKMTKAELKEVKQYLIGQAPDEGEASPAALAEAAATLAAAAAAVSASSE